LRAHLFRLPHPRFEVTVDRDQIIPLEYKRDGLKTKPDKQGDHGYNHGRAQARPFGGLGSGHVILLMCSFCLEIVFHKQLFCAARRLGITGDINALRREQALELLVVRFHGDAR
jgi:hypothetical protein